MDQPTPHVQAEPDAPPQEQPDAQAAWRSPADVLHPQVPDAQVPNAPAQDAQRQTVVAAWSFVAFIMIGSSCVLGGSGDTRKDAGHRRTHLERTAPSGTNAAARLSVAPSARTDRASRRTRRGTRA